MTKWRPLGLILQADSYAQCPTPLVMDDRVRIYFSERDEKNRSFILFADFLLDDPRQYIGESGRVLENGALGAPDDEGQIPAFAEKGRGHEVFLYYSGWNTRQSGAYHNCTMLARSDDGGRSFVRHFDGPVLDREENEPYLRVTPCRLGHRMWYVSGLRWETILGKPEPIYVIRERTIDGNLISIPQKHSQECFSRPWVTKMTDALVMHYSYRLAYDYRDGANAYRIGYAESYDNGKSWVRMDEEFNLPRTDEFDDTMQCYFVPFKVKDKWFAVYNGNSFGKHGFALAEKA